MPESLKEFAETQAADLETRLRKEFPDRSARVWANRANQYRFPPALEDLSDGEHLRR